MSARWLVATGGLLNSQQAAAKSRPSGIQIDGCYIVMKPIKRIEIGVIEMRYRSGHLHQISYVAATRHILKRRTQGSTITCAAPCIVPLLNPALSGGSCDVSAAVSV